MRGRWPTTAAAGAGVLWTLSAPAAPADVGPARMCSEHYADDFTALAPEARNYDDHPEAVFSYCVRNTAAYECLSYGGDGAIRRDRKQVVAHGTAFAYRRQAADTLLLTNDHVASWPAVTDAFHVVDGVPPGCKLLSQSLALVDNERDEYPRDDIPAAVVATDPQLDVAILRARADLQVMRWKIGRSADLGERNVVEVRGFPLGAFRATNIGKVISTHDHDDFGDWDHDDFVIDALLSAGNSGSPVLAVSCVTGEYELVGIYHAGYTEGSALNVVIGIDQVRDLMTTLKRTRSDHQDDPIVLDADARAKVSEALGAGKEAFFPFGGLIASIRERPDGVFLFVLYPKSFPLVPDPLLVIEDRVAARPHDFGTQGQVWIGAARGLKRFDWAQLASDVQGQVTRVHDEMASDVLSYAALVRARDENLQSRRATDRVARLGKTFARLTASRADLVHAVIDLADKLISPTDVDVVHFADVTSSAAEPPLRVPAPQPPAPGLSAPGPEARR